MTRSQRRPQRPTYPEFQAKNGDFVHVSGKPTGFATEIDRVVTNIDHVWITISVGEGESLRIALSTHSRQNAVAGFDPRVRVGMIGSSWTELPAAGLQTCAGLDYRAIEAATPVSFTAYERPALETMLMETTGRAIFLEAWGELYVRKHPGLHQIHSRRGSCSVLTDYLGRDGAIRFYFPDATATMLLLKFCGQP